MHPYDLSTVTGPTSRLLELEAMVAWPRDTEARELAKAVSAEQAEIVKANPEVENDETMAWLGGHSPEAQRACSANRRAAYAAATPPGLGARRVPPRDAQSLVTGHVPGIALRLASDLRTKDREVSINLAKRIVHSDLRGKLPSVGGAAMPSDLRAGG